MNWAKSARTKHERTIFLVCPVCGKRALDVDLFSFAEFLDRCEGFCFSCSSEIYCRPGKYSMACVTIPKSMADNNDPNTTTIEEDDENQNGN
jgi:hypothetical protein